MTASKRTATEESLCLFEPAWALAEWERGSLSPESRSQIETLVSFLDVGSPVCALCRGPLKPIGLMGVIGAPGSVRTAFAVCKACGVSAECDQRIFDALGVTVVSGPSETRARVVVKGKLK
jgi:hypothetical protein